MKTAIITGASRGVGRAIAEKLADEGCRLLINCRTRFDLLDAVAESLSGKTEVISIHGEITEEILKKHLKECGAAVRAADAELNFHWTSTRSETESKIETETKTEMESEAVSAFADTVDSELLLINSGGISTFRLAQDVGDAELMEMLEANLLSMFRLTRAVIPYLLRSGNGRILNISSVWGISGTSMESVYSMTKGGINAFTRALGKELAPSHIPVNALALGAVDTDMNGWMGEEDLERLREEIPYGRMANPAEVADFVSLILKSPKYLTGQILQFDGGWI